MGKNVLIRRAIVAFPAVPQHPVPRLCQAQGWFLLYICLQYTYTLCNTLFTLLSVQITYIVTLLQKTAIKTCV